MVRGTLTRLTVWRQSTHSCQQESTLWSIGVNIVVNRSQPYGQQESTLWSTGVNRWSSSHDTLETVSKFWRIRVVVTTRARKTFTNWVFRGRVGFYIDLMMSFLSKEYWKYSHCLTHHMTDLCYKINTLTIKLCHVTPQTETYTHPKNSSLNFSSKQTS